MGLFGNTPIKPAGGGETMMTEWENADMEKQG